MRLRKNMQNILWAIVARQNLQQQQKLKNQYWTFRSVKKFFFFIFPSNGALKTLWPTHEQWKCSGKLNGRWWAFLLVLLFSSSNFLRAPGSFSCSFSAAHTISLRCSFVAALCMHRNVWMGILLCSKHQHDARNESHTLWQSHWLGM